MRHIVYLCNTPVRIELFLGTSLGNSIECKCCVVSIFSNRPPTWWLFMMSSTVMYNRRQRHIYIFLSGQKKLIVFLIYGLQWSLFSHSIKKKMNIFVQYAFFLLTVGFKCWMLLIFTFSSFYITLNWQAMIVPMVAFEKYSVEKSKCSKPYVECHNLIQYVVT